VLLGVDVGGTFTDAVVFDGERLHTAKVPTTPEDQASGVMATVRAALTRAGAGNDQVESFAHGMTVGTNALLEERGASTASLPPLKEVLSQQLLFLEVVEIAPSRAHVYDLTVPETHSFVANGFVNHNTYLAVAQAVSALLSKSVARIVLARPAVEAGEKLGFLPGDLQEKVDPYLRPLYDALYDLLDYEKVARLLERNAIEVAPIAFMRGRTLNDAFVIIDEAQNTTTEQMKMVLTRIGFGSKVVVTGDITQIDLPQGKVSGLVDAISVLNGVEGISFVYFDEKDVVRHKLVQAVIKAYEAYGAAQTPGK